MHDWYVINYLVNIQAKEIVLQISNEINNQFGKICFEDVLTHSFKCILDYNQIFSVEECTLTDFMNDNMEELMKYEGYCWPTSYKTKKELNEYLLINKYKYIKLFSSYGMFGWVLAKTYQIIIR